MTHQEMAEYDETISLTDVFRRIGKYKTTMLMILGGITALYVVTSLAIYVLTPSVNLSQLDFRLEFRNAEKGMYPNETKFSPTEIVSVPVLSRVYEQNELGRYATFEDFKASVFVVTSNAELEALMRQYRARLSDSKLSAVDRDRIEREFEEKKASLSKANVSVQMQTTDRLTTIPEPLRAKILSDILTVWAEQTVKDKGVSLYDISILSSGTFKDGAVEGFDYIIALDLIRARINRVVENIDQLLELPGAKVLRTEAEQASLEELRVRLLDAQRFRIRPLVGMLNAKGISTSPGPSREFIETQLRFTELETMEARARVETIRNALQTYVAERQSRPGEMTISPGSGSVSPQIDESFLDRLVQLTGDARDLNYRQEMVDELREEAMKAVPLEAEARYYRTLLDSFRGSLRTPTAAEKEAIEAQISAILAEAVRTTDQVNEIYRALSEDLNPSTVLYSATAPVSFSTERSVSTRMLLLMGILLLLVALPVVVIVVLIRDRMQAEEMEEAMGGAAGGTEGSENGDGGGERSDVTGA
jgi:hypothetical protein